MSNILEAIQKSSKTDWQNNREMKMAASSSGSEKTRSESVNKDGEKLWEKEKKQNNSSVREQIFHPVDRLF